MKHEKTFEAIGKLKDVEMELHRLKNALEMANRALDAQTAPKDFKERLAQSIEKMPFGDTAQSFATYVREFK